MGDNVEVIDNGAERPTSSGTDPERPTTSGTIGTNDSRDSSDSKKVSVRSEDEDGRPKRKSSRRSQSVADLPKVCAITGRPTCFDFHDQQAMKDRVRAALLHKPSYSVHDFYYDTGIWQFIAKHHTFENVTLGVISFNALWISVDTDYNGADTLFEATPLFQVAEHGFCIYFTFEWFVRFMAFRRKLDGCKDGWFKFDSALVAMMFGETWILTCVGVIMGGDAQLPIDTAILRLFRLLRLSRLMKMLKSLPELLILIKGMATAMKSVSYVMALLIGVTYVFAIAMTQMAAGTEMGITYFETVPLSMYSLIVYGTFLDALSDWLNDIRAEAPALLVLAFLFICLSALCVMNMLIGVLCEVITAVADTEKEELITETCISAMSLICEELDTDNDGQISFVEFKHILDKHESIKALEAVGVDPIGIVDFADLFFMENGKRIELSFDRFMELVLDLRGSNTATLKDIMNLNNQASSKFLTVQEDARTMNDMAEDLDVRTQVIESSVNRIEDSFGTLLEEIKQLKNKVAGRKKTSPSN